MSAEETDDTRCRASEESDDAEQRITENCKTTNKVSKTNANIFLPTSDEDAESRPSVPSDRQLRVAPLVLGIG